ncbi:alpha/beta fold hydrolase [Nonomuraea pusilla]|uniref:Pimeloyl-ACP methyl ester carboxylesterase n=1 Tax=Nonomuraea pusilla TaxID=46177 RepID=A0A1H8HY46_9ACTN|nr:alpha/beta hydrolase [Nonomuraea pusilla]SEN60618.1 hypothetical protein SAMN05660976_07921 [Nonomuraea pusilla]
MATGKPQAKLHDGNTMDIEVHGQGPTVLLAVNPTPAQGERAEEMRRWGMDPALGRSLIDGLSGSYRVVAFDYEGHVMGVPKPGTLTPDAIAADLLAVADAAGAGRFAYYGYSWLALSGLQLAIRTDRLSALVMGGFPPVAGPYAEMLAVTRATHGMAATPAAAPAGAQAGDGQEGGGQEGGGEYDWSSVEMTLSEEQTRQFVTMYEALQGFDDRAVRLDCPRLCFAGSADVIPYGERWGGVTVDIAGAFARHRAEMESLGWDVEVLDGLDHTGAMQPPNVLPVLVPWLRRVLPADA